MLSIISACFPIFFVLAFIVLIFLMIKDSNNLGEEDVEE